jgi:hypothetical protein
MKIGEKALIFIEKQKTLLVTVNCVDCLVLLF